MQGQQGDIPEVTQDKTSMNLCFMSGRELKTEQSEQWIIGKCLHWFECKSQGLPL